MNDHKLFRESILITLGFVGLLWGIKSWEYAAAADLSYLGIFPRTLAGSVGIITAPFIHGDIQHLISNTFPLIILGVGLFFFYRPIALEVFIVIYVSTGFWVWTIARPAFHIGSSGIVYGLVAFMFFFGLIKRDARSLAVSLIVVFLYHGLFAGIFPLSEEISWESHLLGGLSGLLCAVYYRKKVVFYKDNEPAFADAPEDELRSSSERSATAPREESDTPSLEVPPTLLINFRNSSKDVHSSDDDIISLN